MKTPAQLKAAADLIVSQVDLIDEYIADVEALSHAKETADLNLARLQDTTAAMAAEIKDLRRQIEWPRMGEKLCRVSSTMDWQHPQLDKMASLAGVGRSIVVGQKDIEAEQDGTHDNGGPVDVVRLRSHIEQIPAPAPGLQVVGCLDWEGKKAEQVMSGDEAAILDMLQAVQVAKEAMPVVQWGLYGFPSRLANQGADQWEAEVAASRPLFEAKYDGTDDYIIDAVIVTLYRHYPNAHNHAKGAGWWWSSNALNIVKTVAAAREAADGRPVVAYVMDQFAGVSGAMSDVEFEAYIRTIADAGVDEIVWWQQDHLVGIERGKRTMRSLCRALTVEGLW